MKSCFSFQPPLSSPTMEEDMYYIWLGDRARGPCTLEQMRAMWNEMGIDGKTRMCVAGAQTWQTVQDIEGKLRAGSTGGGTGPETSAAAPSPPAGLAPRDIGEFINAGSTGVAGTEAWRSVQGIQAVLNEWSASASTKEKNPPVPPRAPEAPAKKGFFSGWYQLPALIGSVVAIVAVKALVPMLMPNPYAQPKEDPYTKIAHEAQMKMLRETPPPLSSQGVPDLEEDFRKEMARRGELDKIVPLAPTPQSESAKQHEDLFAPQDDPKNWPEVTAAGICLRLPAQAPLSLHSNTVPASIKHLVRSVEMHGVDLGADVLVVRVIRVNGDTRKFDLKESIASAVAALRQEPDVTQVVNTNEDMIVGVDTPAIKSTATYTRSGQKLGQVNVSFAKGADYWNVMIGCSAEDLPYYAEVILPTLRLKEETAPLEMLAGGPALEKEAEQRRKRQQQFAEGRAQGERLLKEIEKAKNSEAAQLLEAIATIEPEITVAGITLKLPVVPSLKTDKVPAAVKDLVQKFESHHADLESGIMVSINRATYATVQPDLKEAVAGGANGLRQMSGVTQFSTRDEAMTVSGDRAAVKSTTRYTLSGHKIAQVTVAFTRGFDLWTILIAGPADTLAPVADRVVPTIRLEEGGTAEPLSQEKEYSDRYDANLKTAAAMCPEAFDPDHEAFARMKAMDEAARKNNARLFNNPEKPVIFVRTLLEQNKARAANSRATPPAPGATKAKTPSPPAGTAPERPVNITTVEEAKAEAFRRYPESTVEGSELNVAVKARHQFYLKDNPDYFLNKTWPLLLVEEVARDLQNK